MINERHAIQSDNSTIYAQGKIEHIVTTGKESPYPN